MNKLKLRKLILVCSLNVKLIEWENNTKIFDTV